MVHDDRFQLELSTVSNYNFLRCLPAFTTVLLDCLHHRHSFWSNVTKHNMFAIQPLCLNSTQEELRSISVLSSISHGQNSWSSVLQCEVLIREFLSIDRLPASAITTSEISTLAHEFFDNTMEGATFVTKSFLSSAECPEVLHSFGDNIISQMHFDSSELLAIGLDVKVTLDNHFQECNEYATFTTVRFRRREKLEMAVDSS